VFYNLISLRLQLPTEQAAAAVKFGVLFKESLKKSLLSMFEPKRNSNGSLHSILRARASSGKKKYPRRAYTIPKIFKIAMVEQKCGDHKKKK
jgi:hypothetical protein